jgi:hypothetical protein
MALTVKLLAEGTVGTLANTVYDLNTSTGVPSGKAWIIKSMRFTNNDTAVQKINVYCLRTSSVARQISPVDLTVGAGGMAIDDAEVTLAAGDKIQAKVSVAGNKFDYVLSGIERDA